MYQPDSPALGAQPLVLNVPAVQALSNAAVTSGVALPRVQRGLLEKIVTYRAGIALYMTTFRGDKAGGPLLPKLHDIFKLLGEAEKALRQSADEQAVAKNFKRQVAEKDAGNAWNSYHAWQKAKDQQAEEEKLSRERHEIALRAVDKAQEICKNNNGGPTDDNKLGTVVAGLADVAHQRFWAGTSGVPHHLVQSHPVMTELLKGTHQAQDWPVEACAEVDVMKQYLTSFKIRSVSEIDGKSLYFHAEGWSLINSKNPAGGYRWKPWAACNNCSQWFGKINAQRI